MAIWLSLWHRAVLFYIPLCVSVSFYSEVLFYLKVATAEAAIRGRGPILVSSNRRHCAGWTFGTLDELLDTHFWLGLNLDNRGKLYVLLSLKTTQLKILKQWWRTNACVLHKTVAACGWLLLPAAGFQAWKNTGLFHHLALTSSLLNENTVCWRWTRFRSKFRAVGLWLLCGVQQEQWALHGLLSGTTQWHFFPPDSGFQSRQEVIGGIAATASDL